MDALTFQDPMQALGFDEIDLFANRNGCITAKQKRRLLSLFGLKFIAVIVGFMLLIGVVVTFIPRLGTLHSWEVSDWVFLTFGLIFGLGSVYTTWELSFDMIWAKCNFITGYVAVEYNFDQNLGIVAKLKVTDLKTGRQQEFEILTHAFPVKQGSLMCVYFTRGMGELVGLEYYEKQEKALESS